MLRPTQQTFETHHVLGFARLLPGRLVPATSAVAILALLGGVFKEEINAPSTSAFCRMEVRDESGNMLALSNPIWFQHR